MFTAHDEDGSWEQSTHLISLLAAKIFTASLLNVGSTWKTLKDLTFKPGSSQNRRFLKETGGRELPSQNGRVGTYVSKGSLWNRNHKISTEKEVIKIVGLVSFVPQMELLKNVAKVVKSLGRPITSVIRQQGESQNGCFKKTKHAKFSKKRTFFTPWYAHVSVRIRG